jgi:L-alanine-DL-glutamate epimerase-like enolase superfamily enzyme
MRITGISAWEFHRPLDGRAWNPAWRWRERRAPLVLVSTETGHAGIGEGWSDQDEIALFFAHLRDIAPHLLGRDAAALEAIGDALWARRGTAHWVGPAVASAVDIALWDLRGHIEGRPVAELLGAARDIVPVYASGGLYVDGQSAEELAAEMRGYVEDGHDAVKMKIGALAFEEDLARVAAVRHAVGEKIEIIVDAVEQLDRVTAAAWADRLSELGIRFIQAPLPVDDLEGLAALNRGGKLRVLAGEREYRPERFDQLLAARAVGVLQFNLGLCGGITQGLKLVARGEAAGVAASPQCYSTAVIEAASLQLGAARHAVWRVESHMFHRNLATWLPPELRRPDSGRLRIPRRAGLGLALPPLDGDPVAVEDGVLAPVFRLSIP